MAQRYSAPIALRRLARGTCPECGIVAENHDTHPGSWFRPNLITDCPLTPDDVAEAIEQHQQNLEVVNSADEDTDAIESRT